MELSSLIRFFRDCYEADNRRATLWNIFHADIEHRIVFTGREDVLTGFFPRIPAPDAMEARQAAYLYRKEKEYLYCSLFVVGRIAPAGEQHIPICAPLLMYPVDFEENEYGHLFLRPDTDNRQWNYRLLDSLQQKQEDSSLYRALTENIGTEPIGEQQAGELISLLRRYAPGLDCEALYHYPNLLPEKELLALFRSARNDADISLKIVPASVAALVKKPTGTRGVINELTTLSTASSFSNPIHSILGNRPSVPATNQTGQSGLGHVPAILSEAQEQILASAATHDLTLAIGPPGTGKSYTIACLAIEHISRGQTVLIASKSNTAVDVVADKLGQLGLRDCYIRAGKKHYVRELKEHIQNLLSGMYAPGKEGSPPRSSPEALSRSIAVWEKTFLRRLAWETKHTDFFAGQRSGITALISTPFLRWKARRSTPLADLTDYIRQGLEEQSRAIACTIDTVHKQKRHEILRKHRQQFLTFLKALQARTGRKQEELFATIDFRLLFQAFPIWLVNLADIHDVLPLEPHLFDLAIIDEATQCDMASSLPILQRAKRVVITGDPQQLRHLSFLSQERQTSLLAKYEIDTRHYEHTDYRNQSLLDVATGKIERQEQVIFLREHYRSAPSIIGFSNTHFYNNTLHIMTTRPESDEESSVILRQCAGKQTVTGTNPEEADALIADIRTLIETEKQHTNQYSSIGILSPFRAQADYLTEQLGNILSPEDMERHDIMTGTAYSFQGEERDIMFISLVVDANAHSARLRWLDKRDAFNVAITRARKKQYVYTSLPTGIRSTSLAATYLRYITGNTLSHHTKPATVYQTQTIDIVQKELQALGFTTQTFFMIAALSPDLTAFRNGHGLAVDLIGFPDRQQLLSFPERYKMFQRAGLHYIPIEYSHWRTRQQECLDRFRRYSIKISS